MVRTDKQEKHNRIDNPLGKKVVPLKAILAMATKKVYKLRGYDYYLNNYLDWDKELTRYIPEPGLDSWLYYKEWPDNPGEEDKWR